MRISQTLTVDIIEDVYEEDGEPAIWLTNELSVGYPAYSICGDGELIVKNSDIPALIQALVRLGLEIDKSKSKEVRDGS